MIAYCGLNCSKCEALIATREDDDAKREETARKWSKLYRTNIEADQINCQGCISNGPRFSHCDVCDIRHCCSSKGVDNCASCGDYICDKLSAFIKLAPQAGEALEAIRRTKSCPT
jgi:hypothetical protein